MLVKRVIRQMAGLLGFFGAGTQEDPGQTQKQERQTPESISILESIDQIPVHPDCLRARTHFHVVCGEESTYWHAANLCQGPYADYIFDTHEAAHKFFIGQIESILPGFISDDEVDESLNELWRMISDSEYDESITKTTQGIWFEELDIKLAICHRCIPRHLN